VNSSLFGNFSGADVGSPSWPHGCPFMRCFPPLFRLRGTFLLSVCVVMPLMSFSDAAQSQLLGFRLHFIRSFYTLRPPRVNSVPYFPGPRLLSSTAPPLRGVFFFSGDRFPSFLPSRPPRYSPISPPNVALAFWELNRSPGVRASLPCPFQSPFFTFLRILNLFFFSGTVRLWNPPHLAPQCHPPVFASSIMRT